MASLLLILTGELAVVVQPHALALVARSLISRTLMSRNLLATVGAVVPDILHRLRGVLATLRVDVLAVRILTVTVMASVARHVRIELVRALELGIEFFTRRCGDAVMRLRFVLQTLRLGGLGFGIGLCATGLGGGFLGNGLTTLNVVDAMGGFLADPFGLDAAFRLLLTGQGEGESDQ